MECPRAAGSRGCARCRASGRRSQWSMIRRLTSSGTRSSKQRLPASMWKTGIPSRLATTRTCALSVSPRTSSRSGRSSSISSVDAARIRADPARRSPSPLIPRWWSGARTPSSSKKTSLSARVEVLAGVDDDVSSQSSSRRSITRLSRMISGLVPRTISDLHRARAGAEQLVLAEQRADRLEVDDVVGGAVLASRERLASGARRGAARGGAARSPGSSPRANVRRRLLLGDQHLVHLLAGPDAE